MTLGPFPSCVNMHTYSSIICSFIWCSIIIILPSEPEICALSTNELACWRLKCCFVLLSYICSFSSEVEILELEFTLELISALATDSKAFCPTGATIVSGQCPFPFLKELLHCTMAISAQVGFCVSFLKLM